MSNYYSPVILLARGGSGSRLLSLLAQDFGIFIGSELNRSGDSLEMLDAIWNGVERKLSKPSQLTAEETIEKLRHSAGRMLAAAAHNDCWGFKLPESMLLIEELDRCFPSAQFLHLIRDPLSTCLRRTHLTARTDNSIGRLAIGTAYRYCGRDVDLIPVDSPLLHMCYTTIHQVQSVSRYCQQHLVGRHHIIRFEELVGQRQEVFSAVSQFLEKDRIGFVLDEAIDPARAERKKGDFIPEDERKAAEILKALRQELGYLPA